jgi:hypothetical protein
VACCDAEPRERAFSCGTFSGIIRHPCPEGRASWRQRMSKGKSMKKEQKKPKKK